MLRAVSAKNITYFPKGHSMRDESEGNNLATEPFTQHPNHIDAGLTAKAKTLAEVKIVNVVIRKTLGYHKTWDTISFTQFEELTEMSSQGVCNGIQAALERGFIVRLKHGQYWEYSLNYAFFEPFKTTQERGVGNNQVLNDVEYLPLHDVESQKKDLNKITDTNVSGELHSQTTTSNILDFNQSGQTTDQTSQSAFVFELIPVDLKSNRVNRGKVQLQTEKKARAAPKWQELPQFVIWRKYANIKGYRPWPKKEQRDLILQHIPSDQESIERWEGLIIIWLDRKHNYKIFNIDGLVDVFLNGFREKVYPKKGQNP